MAANAHPTKRAIPWKLAALGAATSVAPVALYLLIRPYVTNDTVALAIAAAAPAVLTVTAAIWRRQVRLLSLLAAIGVGLAVTVTLVTGGGSLPLKLYRPGITGVVGLALLVSVLVDRPLLGPVLRLLAARRNIRLSLSRKTLTAVTTIAGIGLVVEAVGTLVLAFVLPTGAYLIAARVVRIVVIGICLAVMVWYAKRAAR